MSQIALPPMLVNVAFGLLVVGALAAAGLLLLSPAPAGGPVLRLAVVGAVLLGVTGVGVNVAKSLRLHQELNLYPADEPTTNPDAGEAARALAITAAVALVGFAGVWLLANVGSGLPVPQPGPLGMVAPPLLDPNSGALL